MTGRTDPSPRHRKLTYEDYVTLPDDGRRYEVLDGELEVSPSPLSVHQLVSANLVFLLAGWVRPRSIGRVWHAPLDVILAPETIVQPDILYISNERSGIVTERAVEGAPDLVIEILSPSTAARDRGPKKQLYARYGVPRYWLIDPTSKTVEIYSLGKAGYESVSMHGADDVVRVDVPDGFTFSVPDLWRTD